MFQEPPMDKTHQYTHGLAVMRAQPLHIAHEKVIRSMLEKCSYATVILGSIQEQGTDRNPFSYTQRKQMIKNVFPDETEAKKLRVIGLFDINNPTEWGNFVLDFMHEAFPELPRPDVYFAGSAYDMQWFKNLFDNFELIDRTNYSFPYVSGSMVRDMMTIGDRRWKDFVNPLNHALVENYTRERNKGIV